MSKFVHIPVLLAEVLETLTPEPNRSYFDGTVGGAGHAEAILARSAPSGRLHGCDRDGAAIEAARGRLAAFAGRFELEQATFAEAALNLPAASLDGALLDLGVSSPQLDGPERGFSFQADGPLDMRMDSRRELTAARWLASVAERDLEEALRVLGDEPNARRLARAIVEERRSVPWRRPDSWRRWWSGWSRGVARASIPRPGCSRPCGCR